ncbi:hypothetical protein [Streptomyces orinoci]|uniref:5-formyltetrahydrofolate cyclo-ligase n=1 Tax=Streptomyces orinoci TaxID=67339 RepID=A0ABV3JSN6_STRON|nr:hypothetical protein [Streptomyces orinoci]
MSETRKPDLAAARRDLLRRRLAGHAATAAAAAPAPAAALPSTAARDSGRPALSSAQRRMWFLDGLLPKGSA